MSVYKDKSESFVWIFVGIFFFALAISVMVSIFVERFIETHGRFTSISTKQKVTIPENMLVLVKNPEPIEVNHREFVFGDQCMVLAGDSVTALAEHDGRVLVETNMPSQWFYGVCVPGVVFFLSREDFLDANKKYEENVRKENEERNLVQSLLEEEK